MPYSAGTAYLTVIPSFLNIQRAFEREAKECAKAFEDAFGDTAAKMGKQFENAVGKAIPKGMAEASKAAEAEGDKAAEKFSGAFAEKIKRRLDDAFKASRKIEVDVDTDPAAAALAGIRDELDDLRKIEIDADFDEGRFFADIMRLRTAVAEVERDGLTVEVRSNAAEVRRELEGILDIRKAARLGNRYGDAFGKALNRRINAAIEAIPDPELDVTANTTPARRELTRVREQLIRLSKTEIDVDVPAAKYLGDVAALEKVLERIEAENIEVDVKVSSNARSVLAELRALRDFAEGTDRSKNKAAADGDKTGRAFAETFRKAIKAGLENLPEAKVGVNPAVRQEIAEIRNRLIELSNIDPDVDVDFNATETLAEINRLETRLRKMAATDIDIDVHTNLLATATELAAVQTLVDRLDGKDIDIHTDTRSLQDLAQTAGISLSRLGLLISLGASIGTAIVPAAAAAAAAVSAIATAASAAVLGVGVLGLGLFGVVKAVSALDKFQKDANKSATSLAGANDRVTNALDNVRGAQRSLARAERERRQAVDDLSRAQEEARRQLEDMAFAARDLALSQRQAVLDAAEAKRDLDRVMTNPRATEEEREQATITYEQRVLQLDELAVKQKRMADDKAKADKAGVAGSEAVLRAQERIADSTEAVISAQEQLAQSQRALAQAYQKTGVAGGEALDNLQEAMDALSPAGQRFALFIFSLKDQFKGLQAAAEGGLLPGLEQGIRNLLPYLPRLEKLVSDVATALGDIFVDFTEAMQDPVWRRFFGYLADTAAPTLMGMAEFAMNVATGIFAIINSLTGFNAPIGEGLLGWSRDFAEWGRNLDQNQGWRKFLDYVSQAAPVVLDFFKNLWKFTEQFVIAAAPIGLIVLKAFGKLFEWLSQIDTQTLTILIGAIAGIGAALLVVAGITAAIGTGITGAIIAGVAALAAGLAVLYAKVEPVRVVVDATVKAIGDAWNWLWSDVINPVSQLISAAVDGLGRRFNDWYSDALKPVVDAVGEVFSALWETLKTIFEAVRPLLEGFAVVAGFVFGAVMVAVEGAARVFNWLWDHVLRPVFQFIGVGFQVLGAIAEVAFGILQIGIKLIAGLFMWLWDVAIKPFWEKIKPFFVYLGEIIDKYVRPPFEAGMKKLGEAWDTFVQAAKKPIRFLVDVVLNKGILAGYNKLAKAFNVHPQDVKIELPEGFAFGGAVWGRGTATSDSIPALLSNGEHVWTAREVAAVGGQDAMYRLRQAALAGALPRFAGGGAVGDFFASLAKKAGDVFAGITDFFSDPAGALRRLADKLFDLIPGKDTDAMKIVLGAPRMIVDSLVDKAKGLLYSATGGGDAGPAGAGPGFLPWPASPGAQRGDTGVWRNILQLVRSSGLPYSFGNSYRHGDPLWHGSGRAIDFMGYHQDALGQFFMNMQNRVLELIHTTAHGRYYITRGRRQASMGDQDELHRNHLHVAMDSGGWIEPGWNPPIWNGTGRPEPVLTGAQWDAIMAGTRGGDGPRNNYHFEFRDTTLDASRLRAMQDREAALARQGRAR